MSKDKDRAYIPAAEVKASQANDPDYLAMRARKDEKFRKLREKYAELERPLLERLRLQGYQADSISDLIKRYAPLPSALVEIVLTSIDECADDVTKEWMIRALAAAGQPFDGRKLCELYDRTNNIQLKWAIANTIASSKPHSIDDWLEKASQDAYLRTTLQKLGFSWMT